MAMKSTSKSELRAAEGSPELRTPWLLVLMLLSPLAIGASCDDEAVVGNECVPGASDAKCGGEAGSGDGNTGGSATGGSSTGGATTGGSAAGGTTTGGNATGGNGDAGGGSAGDTCGGLLGGGCDAGEYCNYPSGALCGAADAPGVCEKKPDACDAIYAPVCGCDDKTYENACAAASNGVSVASEGECDSPPATACGSRGLPACPDGQFCQYDAAASCGEGDAPGTCADLTEGCILIYAPVCGCDGKTYGNSCEAASFGVSVRSDGACEDDPPGETCGGLAGGGCGPDEFCQYPATALCGAADATGTCAAKPQGCTKEYAPVCGCDDVTYGNACMAAAAGVSVLRAGDCEDSSGGGGAVCAGNADCAKDQYCHHAPADQCGELDAAGTCEPRPEACIEIYAPVCGCDGVTYANDCKAAAAGTSVASEGECD